MKFSLIPVGERFQWKGALYTKTSPFVAENVQTGIAKMLPRSTHVEVLSAGQADSKVSKDEGLDKAVAALDQLHKVCSGCLDEMSGDLLGTELGTKLGEARERLAQAYRDAFESLK